MREQDALVGSYIHLDKLPRAGEALRELQKIASLVKPIMRDRGWHVGTLTEFFPEQSNLLGLNVNRGQKICLRLRHAGDRTQFLPLDSCVDTMLHELCHNVHGPHDDDFHKLWNALRDAYDDLRIKGYTGEGFLSEGYRLGGAQVPQHEMRRQQRMAAERRASLQKRSGQRLGGRPVPRSVNIRNVITDAVNRRQTIIEGCGSGNLDRDVRIANEATLNGFRTQAEEDQANERAIAEALWELAQQDNVNQQPQDSQQWTSEGLKWDQDNGLDLPSPGTLHKRSHSAMDSPSSSLFDSQDDQRETRVILDEFPTTAGRRHLIGDTPRPESGTLGDDFVPPQQRQQPPSSSQLASRPRPQAFLPDKPLPRKPPPIQEHPAFRPSGGSGGSSDHSTTPSISSVNSSNATMNSLDPTAFASPVERRGRQASFPLPTALQTRQLQERPSSEEEKEEPYWTCPICTLKNNIDFLCCDACTAARPCDGTIVDFQSLQDLGPDMMPTQAPASPAELPGSGPALLWGDNRPSPSGASHSGAATARAVKLTAAQKTARSIAVATKNAVPPQDRRIGWRCACGAFMEDVWWCCSSCGQMKESS